MLRGPQMFLGLGPMALHVVMIRRPSVLQFLNGFIHMLVDGLKVVHISNLC